MSVKVVKETTDYVIQVASSIEDDDNRLVYQLVNRVYDVVEVETQLLPQALHYLEDLQASLDAKRDQDLEAEAVESTPVVQFPH